MTYEVRWVIELEAGSEVAAAQLAQEIQKDPASIAQVFVVRDSETGRLVEVDLSRPVKEQITRIEWEDSCDSCGKAINRCVC